MKVRVTYCVVLRQHPSQCGISQSSGAASADLRTGRSAFVYVRRLRNAPVFSNSKAWARRSGRAEFAPGVADTDDGFTAKGIGSEPFGSHPGASSEAVVIVIAAPPFLAAQFLCVVLRHAYQYETCGNNLKLPYRSDAEAGCQGNVRSSQAVN